MGIAIMVEFNFEKICTYIIYAGIIVLSLIISPIITYFYILITCSYIIYSRNDAYAIKYKEYSFDHMRDALQDHEYDLVYFLCYHFDKILLFKNVLKYFIWGYIVLFLIGVGSICVGLYLYNIIDEQYKFILLIKIVWNILETVAYLNSTISKYMSYRAEIKECHKNCI